MAEDILRDRIITIYKSGEGINGKIAELKTAFPDGEIIQNVEELYEEGILEVDSDNGSGKDAFLSRGESDQEVTEFWPENLKYKG